MREKGIEKRSDAITPERFVFFCLIEVLFLRQCGEAFQLAKAHTDEGNNDTLVIFSEKDCGEIALILPSVREQCVSVYRSAYRRRKRK